MEVQNVFLKYLLAPLVVLTTTTVMSIFNKKNAILSNKKLIVTILVASLVLALPGLMGLIGFYYMPWGYIFSQIYALIVGAALVYLVTKHYQKMFEEKKAFIIVSALVIIGFAMYLYQLIFDWLSPLEIGWWASSSLFVMIIPLFFWWTYMALLSIPIEIYKLWEYPLQSDDINLDHLDFDKLLVLELELYKNVKDEEPLKVKVKAPENMNFGLWYQKFIDDYNMKFSNAPVAYKDTRGEQYKWIFFVKTKFYKKNVYIDPDLDIISNGITEKMTIHAKRVSENANMN